MATLLPRLLAAPGVFLTSVGGPRLRRVPANTAVRPRARPLVIVDLMLVLSIRRCLELGALLLSSRLMKIETCEFVLSF